MGGKRINGVEYIHLYICNDFKKNSLYDNLHLTLKEIFWNIDSADVSLQAIGYYYLLTDYKLFEDIPEDEFKKILKYLNRITNKKLFEFIDLEEGEDINEKEYIKFDIWWHQFEELKVLLYKQYDTLIKSLKLP
jgi:hypothetical protein